MKNFWERFTSFSLLVQVIFLLCFLSTVLEVAWLCQALAAHSVLWRLHLGFAILCASEMILILLEEKWVCVLTVLQGILALLTTADFIFTPILRFVGGAYFIVTVPTVEGMKVYQYVFVSLAFTLQMFSAHALFVEFNTPPEASIPQDANPL